MKLLSFTILVLFSFASNAVEFNSCTDDKGETHFTNLPKSSLNSNCHPKDHYSLLLNQDYLNLPNEFAKYETASKEQPQIDSKPFELSKAELSAEAVKSKMHDIFDPDKALDELMESTESRDDIYTKAMRGRSKGLENIINQGK